MCVGGLVAGLVCMCLYAQGLVVKGPKNLMCGYLIPEKKCFIPELEFIASFNAM